MTAMRLKRYPSPSGGFALGKMGVGATMLGGWRNPYITDGLVAMYDGEWNAGGGVHDPNATKVKNLATGLGDLYLYGGYSILDKGIQFDGISGYGIGDKLTNTGWSGLSIEYVFSPSLAGGETGKSFGVCGWSYEGDSNKRPSFYIDPARNLYVLITGNDISASYRGVARDAHGLVATGSGGYKIAYLDGTLRNRRSDSLQNFSTTQNRFRVGSYGGKSDQNIGFFGDTMYRVSIYSRALTADEIARNYAIDKERFNLP